MAIPYHQAALLGAIQGLTEFLPVSSDGHLALTQALFGIAHDNLALTVTLHLGTLLATLFFFRRQVAALGGEIGPVSQAVIGRGKGESSRLLQHDLTVVLVASLPTALIGLLLRDSVERWTRSPWAVALGFFATAAALASTARVRRGKRDRPSLKATLMLGVVQGLAVAPGLSRSATTIAVALHAGVKPERAFELSMLISLPAVLGAVMLELPALIGGGGAGASVLSLSLGVVTAFGVGLFALRWLRRWVQQGRFASFALWVVPMGLVAMASASYWPK